MPYRKNDTELRPASRIFARETVQLSNGQSRSRRIWKGEYESLSKERTLVSPVDDVIYQACQDEGIELDFVTAKFWTTEYRDQDNTPFGDLQLMGASRFPAGRILYPIPQSPQNLQPYDDRLPGVVYLPMYSIPEFIQFIEIHHGPLVALLADKYRYPFYPWSDFRITDKTNNFFDLSMTYSNEFPIIHEKDLHNPDVLGRSFQSSWHQAYPITLQKDSPSELLMEYPAQLPAVTKSFNVLVLGQSLSLGTRAAYRKDMIIFLPALRKDPDYPTMEEREDYQRRNEIAILTIHEILWYYQSLGYNYQWKMDSRKSIFGVETF